MANVVAVIPARSGSKGIVDKNIKLLAGRPLIAYSIMAAKAAKNIDRVIFSTDSEHYAEIAREYGAETPFLRPYEISADDSTDYDFIKHLLDWMLQNEGYQPEYLVHLRPTTPLREVAYIEKAIETMKGYSDRITALRSVHEMSESAYKTFEIEEEYLKCVGGSSCDIDNSNRARQKFKKTYQANGYVDVIKSSFVMENKKIHGDRVLAYVTPSVIEVDTESDFGYLEHQVKRDSLFIKEIFK